MITCSVCGGLNDPNNMVCEHCGSDLIDETEAMALYYDDDSEPDSSNDDYSSDSSYIDDEDEYDDDY